MHFVPGNGILSGFPVGVLPWAAPANLEKPGSKEIAAFRKPDASMKHLSRWNRPRRNVQSFFSKHGPGVPQGSPPRPFHFPGFEAAPGGEADECNRPRAGDVHVQDRRGQHARVRGEGDGVARRRAGDAPGELGKAAEDASGTRPFLQIISSGTRPQPLLPVPPSAGAVLLRVRVRVRV
eukprot:gene12001-biopygen7905